MFRQQLRHLCQQHSHPHGPSKCWQPCQDLHRAEWALAEDLCAQLVPKVEPRRKEGLTKEAAPGVPGSWLLSLRVCSKLLVCSSLSCMSVVGGPKGPSPLRLSWTRTPASRCPCRSGAFHPGSEGLVSWSTLLVILGLPAWKVW